MHISEAFVSELVENCEGMIDPSFIIVINGSRSIFFAWLNDNLYTFSSELIISRTLQRVSRWCLRLWGLMERYFNLKPSVISSSTMPNGRMFQSEIFAGMHWMIGYTIAVNISHINLPLSCFCLCCNWFINCQYQVIFLVHMFFILKKERKLFIISSSFMHSGIAGGGMYPLAMPLSMHEKICHSISYEVTLYSRTNHW